MKKAQALYRYDTMKFMKRPPIPRHDVYELYWQFAAERQAIFEHRLAGHTAPWTDDPVLSEYKFCNVFRATDRITQYLLREIIYSPQSRTDADLLFQVVMFRFFSREHTWDRLSSLLGHAPLLDDLASGDLESALTTLDNDSAPLYTNAFILCASDAYGRGRKYLNHVALFRHMFLEDRLDDHLLRARSLAEIYEALHAYPLMGDFMSYQIAIDLNYTDCIPFDENDFTKAGPGALRGIAKCFVSRGDYTPEEIIMWMVDHQTEEFNRLGLTFHGLFGRDLHAIDAQGLFCETDKYARVARPDLRSARVRMKQRFAPQSTPRPIVLPPKWHLTGEMLQ